MIPPKRMSSAQDNQPHGEYSQHLIAIAKLLTPVTAVPEESPPNKGGGDLPPNRTSTAVTEPVVQPQSAVPPQPSFLVQIPPPGQTGMGRWVHTPSHLGDAAYHCNALVQSEMAHVADYHPLTLLQMFAPTIKQPKGHPDVMPLHIALQQPDQDKFVDPMAKELQ